jgi:hypothetical protein
VRFLLNIPDPRQDAFEHLLFGVIVGVTFHQVDDDFLAPNPFLRHSQHGQVFLT